MNLQNQRRKEIITQIKQLNKELFGITIEIEEDEIWNDVFLYDKINGLIEKFDKRNIRKLKADVLDIYTSLSTKRVFRIDENPIDIINEETKTMPAHNMPYFIGLDRRIKRGMPIVVGSPPGVGKTTFACNFMYDNYKQKKYSAMFSFEMPIEDIWIKLFLIYLDIEHKKCYDFYTIENIVKNSDVMSEYYKSFIKFVDSAYKYILIINASRMTPLQIVGYSDHIANQFGQYPDYTFIDYVQRIHPDSNMMRRTIREHNIFCSQCFMDKSKATNSVYMIISQMNKENEYKESGAYSEDAAMCLVLNREKNKTTLEFAPEIEIEIKKNRYGRCGKSFVPFNGVTGVIG